MEKTYKYEDIEQILAQADDLLQQFDPKIIAHLKEEQQAQLEEQAQILKKLKSEVHDKIGKEEPAKSKPYSEGMHEAIDDIVKAMHVMMGTYINNNRILHIVSLPPIKMSIMRLTVCIKNKNI